MRSEAILQKVSTHVRNLAVDSSFCSSGAKMTPLNELRQSVHISILVSAAQAHMGSVGYQPELIARKRVMAQVSPILMPLMVATGRAPVGYFEVSCLTAGQSA